MPSQGQFDNPSSGHSLRVAALACELGKTIGMPERDLKTVRKAALLHGCEPGLFEGPALSRLAKEVLGGRTEGSGYNGPSVTLSPAVLEVLSAFHGLRDGPAAQLSELIHVADSIDGCIEWEPYGSTNGPDPVGLLWDSPLIGAGLGRLRAANFEDLKSLAPKLPPFSDAARKALLGLVKQDLSVDEIASIAGGDPSFAAKIVAAANSAFFSPAMEIRSLPQAVGYIGCMTARKVLMAAALADFFAPPRMRPLLQHSLECADIAAQIAAMSGKIAGSEAFLAGLMHDIGGLAMLLIDESAMERRDRLVESGCPQTYAEVVVCGFDHGAAGATVLERWGFSKDLIAAVEFHHKPEKTDSLMAAVLYIAEFWTCSEEDLPSAVRLHEAFDRLKLSTEMLNKRNPHPSQMLLNAFTKIPA